MATDIARREFIVGFGGVATWPLAARTQIPGLPVLVLSQYVEESYAAELLGGGASGVGYLLKDRVGRVEEFLDALDRVAAGNSDQSQAVHPGIKGTRQW